MDEVNKIHEQIKEKVITAKEEWNIVTAAQLLDKHTIGSLIVTKDEKLVGILTERDIIRSVVAKGLAPNKVLIKDVMTKNVVTADVKFGIKKIFEMLQKAPFRHLPIVDDGKPVGMVSKRDLLYLFDHKTDSVK